MVPDGWTEEYVKGLVRSLDAGVSVNSEDDGNENATHKILKTSCVSYGYFKSDETKSVIEQSEIARLREPVIANSIIISRMNTPALVGANAYVEIALNNTYLPDRLWQLKPKNKVVEMRWLAYWLGSAHTRYRLSNLGTGTSGSMKNITKSDVLKLALLVPPLPEQKKIAQILSTWDKAITTTEQLLANSQQQKKALMQQLLTGKKRLLDENGVRFSGDWNSGKLSDIAIIDSGYAFKSDDFTESVCGVPVIRMSDFKSGGIDISGAAKVVVEATGGLDKFKLRAGDFIFGMSGSLSNYGWVKENDIPCYLNQRVGRILAKECSVQLFVSYLFLSDKIQKLIIDKAAGAAQLNISVSDLRATNIQYPSYQEQHRIANVLVTAENHIAAIQQKLEALKQEKKALMQQLLTGKRRVKVDEEAA